MLLATATVPTTAAGHEHLLAWARNFGTLGLAREECTGSHGAALAGYRAASGEPDSSQPR